MGFYENGANADLSQALHFNGKKWSVVSTPDPGGKGSGDENFLYGVRCVKPSDCWAVGYTRRSGAAELNQALRWNGKDWRTVRTPNPGGKGPNDDNVLEAVACVKASNCWAVGDTQRSGAAELNQALHYDGKKWRAVRTPDPGGKGSGDDSFLDGVRCVKASNCWAVGGTDSRLTDGTNASRNEALRWNGKRWSHVKTPQPSTTASLFGNPLDSVFCSSAKHCWAVGYYVRNITSSEVAIFNEALHWNGKKWSHVSTPQPGGGTGISGSFGVSCVSASRCRAVGTAGPDLLHLSNWALHWNGKHWAAG